MYIRHNCTEEFLGDLRGISQSTVSRILSDLVPVVKAVLAEFVPDAKQAIQAVKGKVCLVDGTITPCWSYAEHRELWSRKHGTTGFCVQLIGLLDGTPIWISDPLPGNTHDKNAFDTTDTTDLIKNALAGIGDKGYQGADLFTPTKKTTRPQTQQGRKDGQRRTIRASRTDRTSRRPLQELAHTPHRLPPPLRHLPRHLRRYPRIILLLNQMEF